MSIGIMELAVSAASGVVFRIRTVSGKEAIHAPWRFVVICELLDEVTGLAADVDAEDWLGSGATLTWASAEGEERALTGIVCEVAVSFGEAEFVILPALGARPDETDHRTFVGEDAVAIAKKVLGEHAITVDSRVTRTPDKKAQVLQLFEGDVDFVARILADEGIAYYLSADGRSVVLADGRSGFEPLSLALPVRDATSMHAGFAVFRPRMSRRAVVAEVALRDYDFTKPKLDLTVRSGDEAAGATAYEFPGGYRTPATGNALAAARLAELQKDKLVLTGESNARMLRAGAILTVEDAPRDDMNGDWLLVAVEHEVLEREGGEAPYRARFRAVPATGGFRPDRRPAPRLGGVQHGKVTGASGTEIDPDEHGAVHVSHRWDHRSPGDDKSSARVRTLQPNTYGSVLIPRVGWETLLGFANGAHDEPVVLGRLYNAETPPPAALPAARVESALVSRTSPGGGSANRIGTNDTAGAEGFAFHASKDYEERTVNDKVTAIGANDKWDIGTAHALNIGQVFNDNVDGARDGTVALYHGISVGSNYSFQAADEFVGVGGARIIHSWGNHGTICKNFIRLVGKTEIQAPIEHQTRTVKGGSLVVNTGGWINHASATVGMSIGGASGLKVGGAQSVKVGTYSCNVKGAISEKYTSRKVDGANIVDAFRGIGTFKTDGAADFKGKVTFEAKSKITIKAGGVKIVMTKSSIKVTGKFEGKDAVQDSDETKYG
jgi:type VI secretion system secreted protein VgrG